MAGTAEPLTTNSCPHDTFSSDSPRLALRIFGHSGGVAWQPAPGGYCAAGGPDAYRDDGVNLSIPVGPSFKQVPPPPLSVALQIYEASPGRTRVSLSPLSLPKIPSKKEVCAVVEHGSAKIRANAVEKELRLIDLKGPEVEGCYYAATDRAPKPGEHKYLYQGAVALRDVLVMFTVLFNDGAEREADTAINMVRSLKLVPQK